jgi:hypothetical protein
MTYAYYDLLEATDKIPPDNLTTWRPPYFLPFTVSSLSCTIDRQNLGGSL